MRLPFDKVQKDIDELHRLVEQFKAAAVGVATASDISYLEDKINTAAQELLDKAAKDVADGIGALKLYAINLAEAAVEEARNPQDALEDQAAKYGQPEGKSSDSEEHEEEGA